MTSSVRIMVSDDSPGNSQGWAYVSTLYLKQDSYTFNAGLVNNVSSFSDQLMQQIDQYLENSDYELGILFCAKDQSPFFLKNRWRVFSNPFVQTEEFIMIKLLPNFHYDHLSDFLSRSIDIPKHDLVMSK